MQLKLSHSNVGNFFRHVFHLGPSKGVILDGSFLREAIQKNIFTDIVTMLKKTPDFDKKEHDIFVHNNVNLLKNPRLIQNLANKYLLEKVYNEFKSVTGIDLHKIIKKDLEAKKHAPKKNNNVIPLKRVTPVPKPAKKEDSKKQTKKEETKKEAPKEAVKKEEPKVEAKTEPTKEESKPTTNVEKLEAQATAPQAAIAVSK